MNKVYDAINLYVNNGRHPELKKYYMQVYDEYINSGGNKTIEYFFNTLDEYNYSGYCGF